MKRVAGAARYFIHSRGKAIREIEDTDLRSEPRPPGMTSTTDWRIARQNVWKFNSREKWGRMFAPASTMTPRLHGDGAHISAACARANWINICIRYVCTYVSYSTHVRRTPYVLHRNWRYDTASTYHRVSHVWFFQIFHTRDVLERRASASISAPRRIFASIYNWQTVSGLSLTIYQFFITSAIYTDIMRNFSFVRNSRTLQLRLEDDLSLLTSARFNDTRELIDRHAI